MLREEWGFQGMVVTDSAMGNTSWMDVNLAIRAGGDMMLCLMGVTLDSSGNTAQQAMRTACHNTPLTPRPTAPPCPAAADTSPYWLVLLVVLDTAVLSAALFVFLNRSKWKDSVKFLPEWPLWWSSPWCLPSFSGPPSSAPAAWPRPTATSSPPHPHSPPRPVQPTQSSAPSADA